MQCQVIQQFNRRGVPQLPGSIINVPEELIPNMGAYVQPFVCHACKTGGRICGAPLREGINGFWSCSNPACQVPFKKQVSP